MLNEVYKEIYDYLDAHVAGQEEAKQKLSILGYLYLNRCENIVNDVPRNELPALNTFIVGGTGSGKTYMLSILAEYMNLPFIRIDCSSLTQVGYAGVGIDEQLQIISSKMQEVGFGIIMLDEFDKLGNPQETVDGRIPAVGVQYDLLDLLDGVYDHPDVPNYINNCLVLCAGAFTRATEAHHKKNAVGTNIGFMSKESDETTPIDWKDLMSKSGLISEVIGRFVDIIETKKLSKNEIKEVITKKNNGIYDKYKKLNNKDLLFTEEDLDKLIEDTYNSKYGLRELDTAVYKMTSQKLLEKVSSIKEKKKSNKTKKRVTKKGERDV